MQKYNRIKCFVLNSELVGFCFLGQSDLKVLLVQKFNKIKCFVLNSELVGFSFEVRVIFKCFWCSSITE